MEWMFGFEDEGANDIVGLNSNMKLVPWISWDEWMFVKECLFSSNHESVVSAIQRIRTWQSRGIIPVLVEVTASIVEIQQKDHFFRDDLDETRSSSEELSMLYCMSIMRLVNGVIEKSRRKNEISIGEAAEAISIPRILIDIRHEGSHRDLPSLKLLRLASQKALDWLVWYYWEPQEKMIIASSDSSANLKIEVKDSILEVARCLKEKKRKSGPKKFKGKSARSIQHKKALKNIIRLFSSFSQEVVDSLLDYLLNALNSHLREISDDLETSQSSEVKKTAFDDLKSIVMKLSRKDPEFLLSLTQAVLDKLETNEVFDRETDEKGMMQISRIRPQTKLYWCLLEWLTRNMKKLTESSENKTDMIEKHLSKPNLRGLLHRCLLISSSVNNQAARSAAVTLAQLNGNSFLQHKVEKLVSLLHQPLDSETGSFDLAEEESFLSQAKEKYNSITELKIHTQTQEPVKSKWALAKSWNPCPIGMIPHHVGFSGRLPTLDHRSSDRSSSISKRRGEIQNCSNISAKKVKYSEADKLAKSVENLSGDCGTGHLMIEGSWKGIEEQELLHIASTVRLLV